MATWSKPPGNSPSGVDLKSPQNPKTPFTCVEILEKMNQTVSHYLSKKIEQRNKRIGALNVDCSKIDKINLESEGARYFGFPDNTAAVDPD